MNEKEARAGKPGHMHPLTMAIHEMAAIFGELGFSVASGPELETEFYNFDALNIPKDHPARDMQDTFWVKTKKDSDQFVLRTHTSPVQVRYMQSHTPPIRIIAPGKVYRNEATDATHEAQFFQLEGLLVDTTTSMTELKGTLEYFFKRYFEETVEIRFRPSYFAFVEPGIEVDVKRGDKWLEMLGAGMVHPNVLSTAGIDPKKYRGFAFGFGVDRLVLVKYGIDDIRHLYSGDLRLVNQF